MKKYAVFLAIGVTAASFSAILIRFSDQHPLVISFYRMLLASIMLLPFAFAELKKNPLPRRTILGLVGVGAVLAIHLGLWIASVQMTTVASATILICAHPLFVVPLGQRTAGERLHSGAMVGVCIAFAGIVILGVGDLKGGNIWGDMAALAGGIAAGVYIIAGRRARTGGIGLFSYVWIVYTACAAFTLLAILPLGAFNTSFSTNEWLVFLSLAIVPTILGHTMINASLKKMRSGVVSTAILMEPLGAIILAVILFAEIPPAMSLAGGIITLFGLVLVVRSR
ncbi:MAG: DMT family transporter [Thermoplasmata archaeon]|nr:DMT family transporter [Thermoplasmata archaeon]